MAIPIRAGNSSSQNFSEMDNACVSKEHWKIMFISGMGFFTNAYDLFIVGIVMSLVKPMWHTGKSEEGLVESTTLLATAFGALLFITLTMLPEAKGKSLEEISADPASPAERAVAA